ncbi:RNA polymerase subunit sigma-54 [Cryomorpha ignava]|uniref:RNA polymerase subunit sigma-54 n=1 Tax=Cryomorpha ignava TaxID=101383 RepID=A0A7K3WU29_9FLAO|nr:HPF/RaiA family ribosome-associated protein [Cryomorpha ignava]NEN24986.1 RNA polymerase subunit sigma-54 [Cryomorpha ignava]
MDKTIQPVNFNASQDLLIHVGEIFDKLDKFNDKIVSADIYLKSLRETPTKEKKIEVRLFIPGKDIFIEQQADSFISAAQQAFDRLKVIIIKDKEKQKSY